MGVFNQSGARQVQGDRNVIHVVSQASLFYIYLLNKIYWFSFHLKDIVSFLWKKRSRVCTGSEPDINYKEPDLR